MSEALSRAVVESVNHHLRTPVAVIMLNSEMLIDHGHELPEDVQCSLACILRSGLRLNDVVAGIGELIDVVCLGINVRDTVDVSHVLADEVATYMDRAEARGIRLDVSTGGAVSCVGSPSRLRRALRELLDNAVTYAPDGSTVCVTATVTATGVRNTIRDHGTGIDAADRDRFMRPFERGTHPRQEATGLGMNPPFGFVGECR
ncbi:sensor histidine kinase [Georgenia muralis]|uniref:Sensor-like histidine kinase SenX3 n=1 Tax=Georgenia muralis TaxID=154117 RepID=A0A3N4ZSS7_9MICO|nr:HAMP domain-containing sensor histidine kinase [Georgenia muralis]RPF28532.1 phospho-acceptor domain-containing protein [Georgenia muralis]